MLISIAQHPYLSLHSTPEISSTRPPLPKLTGQACRCLRGLYLFLCVPEPPLQISSPSRPRLAAVLPLHRPVSTPSFSLIADFHLDPSPRPPQSSLVLRVYTLPHSFGNHNKAKQRKDLNRPSNEQPSFNQSTFPEYSRATRFLSTYVSSSHPDYHHIQDLPVESSQ